MINKNQVIIISSMLLISITILSLLTATAQTPRTSKLFECDNSVPALDAFRYNDGRQLSYDVIGCPIHSIVIHDWHDINAIDKSSINVVLNNKGLIEKEEFNRDTGIIVNSTSIEVK